MPPSYVRYSRTGALVRLAFGAAALIGGEAVAQLDLTLNWARVFAGDQVNSSDYATGAAVLTDGTVGTTGWYQGNLLIEAPAPSAKAFVSFLPGPDGDPDDGWAQKFEVVQYGGQVASMAAAVSPRNVETRNHALVAGRFSGTVNFQAPAGARTSIGSTRDVFVAKVLRDPPDASGQTLWVTAFGGDGQGLDGNQEATCLAAGPECEPQNPQPLPGSELRYFRCQYPATFVAVGGFFETEIAFPGEIAVPTREGGEDAWVGLFGSGSNQGQDQFPGGDFILGLAIGSRGSPGTGGDDRVLGIAVDGVDQSVIVAGYYDSDAVGSDRIDFDRDNIGPMGEHTAVYPPGNQGGQDIFVAKYRIEQVQYFGGPRLLLDWVYTTGTSGDDAASCVGVDAAGDVYAAGWRRDGGGKRDIWVAKILRTGPVNNTPQWQFTYTNGANHGDDAALGLAIDGLDRILISGQFGYPRIAGGGGTPNYTLDFNRGGGVSNLTTAGGTDLFVTRLRPDSGTFDWAFQVGSTYNEVSAAVAVDPIYSTRIAHAGWFGDPDAPTSPQYIVDFNPAGGVSNKIGKGRTDAFVSSFLPTIPAGVKTQATLPLDDSGSVYEGEYVEMMAVLAEHLVDPAVVPTNSKAALNAVLFSTGVDKTNGGAGAPIMPWTVFTPITADLFARRLLNLARYPGDTDRTLIAPGVEVAVERHEFAALFQNLNACYHSIDVVADGMTHPADDRPASENVMNAARVNALASAYVDQLNAIAVDGTDNTSPDQEYFQDHIDPGEHFSDSKTTVNGNAFPYENLGVTYATETSGYFDIEFTNYVRMLLKRSTHLPGDFDGDGDVDQADITGPSGFTARWNAQDPYADWNFDEDWSPGAYDLDFNIFMAAHALGSCPQ